jgi:hypothetical protein
MRDAQDIHICNDEVMIHILDPKNGTPPFLSSRPISLVGREDLANFFLGHIENGLKDSTSKSAKFRAIEAGRPSGLCAGMFDHSITLVSGSQQLASCLDHVMSQNHAIASGDLVVCHFEAINYQGIRFLALFKIDPSSTLLQETRIDEQGQSLVELTVRPNALPTTKEKLQKCAFIRPHNLENPDFDMLLLDRQSSFFKDNGIAKFFIEGFLEAEHSLNDTQRTERLYKALVSSHNQIKNNLTLQENADLDNRIRLAVTGQSINVDSWIEQLPIPEEEKQVIRSEIERNLPDREFNIDQDKGAEFTRRKIFKGDYHLRFAIDAEGYERIIRDEGVISDDPSRPPYRRIVIEAENWDEIPYNK